MLSRLFLYQTKKFLRNFSQATLKIDSQTVPPYIQLSEEYNEDSNSKLALNLIKCMTVLEDFITQEEERNIFDELEPYLKRLRYEFDHWDDAIHGYRETERLNWNEKNKATIDRVRELAFQDGSYLLKHIHVLDLDKKGYIKPHIDAVRFCGDTIAGLSLLSDSVMRLVHDKNKNLYADVLLKRRSLYVMKNDARYLYTHEILSNEFSKFLGVPVVKDRRISVICRNAPREEDKD